MILQLLSILLLVGVAEANDAATEPNPKMWYVDPQLGVMWTSPCEQKMKEAMKLISPYIDYGDQTTFRDALYRSPQAQLREEADRLDKRDVALRKWEAIYKECVK